MFFSVSFDVQSDNILSNFEGYHNDSNNMKEKVVIKDMTPKQ